MKIWASGIYVVSIYTHLPLNINVKVILGLFGALFPKLGSNSKTAHRRAKLTKIWASGVYVPGSIHVGTCIFDLAHIKVMWGHLVHSSEKKECNS